MVADVPLLGPADQGVGNSICGMPTSGWNKFLFPPTQMVFAIAANSKECWRWVREKRGIATAAEGSNQFSGIMPNTRGAVDQAACANDDPHAVSIPHEKGMLTVIMVGDQDWPP